MSEAQEKRIFQRGRFTDPVQFHSLDEQHSGGSIACDVSEGGIRLNAGQFVPVDTELSLQIQFAKDNVWHCIGRIVWVEEIPLNERFRFGVQFSRVDFKPLFQQQIQSYMNGSSS
jgi:hypothetical protein